MYQIFVEHLIIASKILLSRLTRPATVDTNIVYAHLVDPSFKLETHHGRFIGCFSLRPDGSPCFYLAGRTHPEEEISHLFVYYVNCQFNKIQATEVEALKAFLPKISEPASGLKIGIINVQCSAHPVTHLSTLIEAVDYSIGPQLLTEFVPCQIIDTDVRDLAIGPMSSCRLWHCDGFPTEEIVSQLDNIVKKHNMSFELGDIDSNLDKPDVTLIRNNGHLIGTFFSKESKVVNYLLVHKNQFEDSETYATIKRLTSSWHDVVEDHCCTRFYPNKFSRCDDESVVLAWQLILEFQPHVLTTIQENELRYMTNDRSAMNLELTELRRANFERRYPSDKRQLSRGTPEQVASASQVKLIFSSNAKRPRGMSVDSQATEIVHSSEWRKDLILWRELSQERKRIKDSIIPPVHIIEPETDMEQKYLENLPCFHNGIELMSHVWNRYAPTVATQTILYEHDKESVNSIGARFVIYPVKSSIGDDCLVILDQVNHRWIFLRANNMEYKDPEYYREVTYRWIVSLFPELSDYEGGPILITSAFHTEYPRIHLLMSLYVITRLFRYSVALPAKIIFGESEFRKYASNICVELQITNVEYNLSHNLVDSFGYLKDNAKQSLPSPLISQHCVVPKDQCMFCKKRGFKNLGRHLSMQHGGQADYANRSRLEVD